MTNHSSGDSGGDASQSPVRAQYILCVFNSVSLKLAQNKTPEHRAGLFNGTPRSSGSALFPLPQRTQLHGVLVCLPLLTLPEPPIGGTRYKDTNTMVHLGVSLSCFWVLVSLRHYHFWILKKKHQHLVPQLLEQGLKLLPGEKSRKA